MFLWQHRAYYDEGHHRITKATELNFDTQTSHDLLEFYNALTKLGTDSIPRNALRRIHDDVLDEGMPASSVPDVDMMDRNAIPKTPLQKMKRDAVPSPFRFMAMSTVT